jgi:HK97 family phage major capsid protein
MKTLKELLEQRDTLVTELEALVRPVIDDGAELTEEQADPQGGADRRDRHLDPRIDELEASEARKAKFSEARKVAGAHVDVSVTAEPRTYGEGSPNSYFADFVRASSPMWKGHADAMQRLAKYDYEVSIEVARGSDEGKRAERLIREDRRGDSAREVDDAIASMRDRGNAGSAAGLEQRVGGMSTGAASGGSFVTPSYFIQDYAPYRKPGRAFIDQTNKHDLPEYGMTVYIPAVLTDAQVGDQSTGPGVNENTAVVETDPTAGYLSADLDTKAGQVVVSQQLLDRAGPNFAFDKLIFDQLTRDYNAQADAFVLAKALATAGTIAYNGSAFTLTSGTETAGSFYQKISGAKAKIRTAAGVVMDPTHLFLDPTRWEYCVAQSDSQGRPLIVPGYANPMNAAGAGNQSGDPGFEGDTGYRLNGLPVFHDLNIPTPAQGSDQAIVGALNEVYTWEGELVPRVLPQTYGNQLSVLLQVYSYLAVIVRYPTAVQKITGTALSAPVF